ncbi:C45 family peptidase [Conexibacter stalactiti]|uniref:C45 family peptidase n=1 Tax=Conexibacter stalactiti TaxID=1940611 RepID=A0ABU4HUI7_9ACTN|nr:C45 family peptidase [Conexibacter stalactiti]MDW5596997.1 C45 family peptidase [Conexibacter stalactiti]MEC5037639.1 C45 family peptidase [Conexibacter stalactiti]
MTAIPEIDAPGSGRAAGVAHGESARALVREHHALVVQRLAARGVTAAQARERALPFRAATAAVAPRLAEEVDGVGEGAGLTADDGWLLQLRAELTIAPGAQEPECTTVALTGPAAAQGTLAAQNVDLPPAYRPLLIALRRGDGHAPDLLTITPAGQVGHHGMNAAGVVVLANFLHAPGWQVGLPRYLLTRIALACSTVAEAVAAIATVPRSGPRNLLLAGPDGIVDLETTPAAVARIEPSHGVLVHANHFEGPLAIHESATEAWLTNSRHRAGRLRTLLAGAPPVDLPALRAMLADRGGVPHALSHHADDDASADVETVAATIADVDARRLWVCSGPPDAGEFLPYAVGAAAARQDAA